MSAPIRVLVVDDSAFARKVVREILTVPLTIEVVGSARDGEEALALTAALNPDVVVCDLRMPRLDGVGFVRRQMQLRPVPVLILSAAAQDAEEVVEALNAGAIDVVSKPSALATDELRGVKDQLLAKVAAASGAPVTNLLGESVAKPVPLAPHESRVGIVCIGISTGGPQALRRMMPVFPANFAAPVAIALHMPVGYTALYAEKLDEICDLEIKEAEDGDYLQPGRALLAPAGKHLTFRNTAKGTVVAHLGLHPIEKIHRPSVDVMFRSAAEVFGERVLAVVMTGMGDDGCEGAAWIKARGGSVLTEAEKSCVIYGMPRTVVEAGLSDASHSLDEMAQAITSRL
ncbi:MAG TPA: chemotaxis-specific protein-glutamate methyltransferase CheB [Candidatus Didemnitutus sp.]|nr:chemotaxis-specific protein-glutamate methyltransferase CheB [Candidatus Didemnitutus sp.]